MDQKERIDVAQRVLCWSIESTKYKLACKVDGYEFDNDAFNVRFLSNDGKLIGNKGINIPGQWIEDIDPTANKIHPKLEILFRNLEKRSNKG